MSRVSEITVIVERGELSQPDLRSNAQRSLCDPPSGLQLKTLTLLLILVLASAAVLLSTVSENLKS